MIAFIYSVMYINTDGKYNTKHFRADTRMGCINKIHDWLESVNKTAHEILMFDDTGKHS